LVDGQVIRSMLQIVACRRNVGSRNPPDLVADFRLTLDAFVEHFDAFKDYPPGLFTRGKTGMPVSIANRIYRARPMRFAMLTGILQTTRPYSTLSPADLTSFS
jgi:hypothetical protein